MWSQITIFALLVFLVISTLTDLRERKIKNKLVLFFLLFRLVFWLDPLTLANLYGMIFGFAVFFIPAFIMNRPMGGDIKGYAIVGLYLGIELTLIHFVVTWLITMVCYIVGKLTSIMKKGYKFPMAPVFLIAYFISVYLVSTGLYDTATMSVQAFLLRN